MSRRRLTGILAHLSREGGALCGSADSVRVTDSKLGEGEIVSISHPKYGKIRWEGGGVSIVDKPNLCAMVEASKS